MNIEESLYTALVAAGTAAGARVYPQLLPQNPTFPAITYSRIASRREYAHGGTTAINDILFQVSCWGATYTAAKALSAQVQAALAGFTGLLGGPAGEYVGKSLVVDEADLYDPETGIFHVPVSFSIGIVE